MNYSPEQIDQTLERARHQWRRQSAQLPFDAGPGIAVPPSTIAISREAGAGGSLVGREIGRRQGWVVYDHELLDKISGEPGLRTELLESLDENTSRWLLETLDQFGGVRSAEGGTYGRHLAETMLALSAGGECVIVGRGATMLLPPHSTLRARLVAPFEYRVGQVRAEQGISDAAARELVERIDRDRAAFVGQFFGRDVRDMHHYDLVINMSRYSVADAARMIIDALGFRIAVCQTAHAGSTTAEYAASR